MAIVMGLVLIFGGGFFTYLALRPFAAPSSLLPFNRSLQLTAKSAAAFGVVPALRAPAATELRL